MTFRPNLWASVAVAAALIVLVSLGAWQLNRRAESQALATLQEMRLAAPPLGVADVDVGSTNTLAAMEFRPIRLTGRYLPGGEIKLLNRTRNGRPGVHLISPLLTADGAATVLVDRGWVPLDGTALPPSTDSVTVEGYIRLFTQPPRFVPNNDPASATWFYLDRDAIAAALGLRNVVPYYVQRAPGDRADDAYPVGDVPTTTVERPHLQYALTWFALAVVLVIIYLVYHLRRDGER